MLVTHYIPVLGDFKATNVRNSRNITPHGLELTVAENQTCAYILLMHGPLSVDHLDAALLYLCGKLSTVGSTAVTQTRRDLSIQARERHRC
jgi:hypothetical protein